MGTEASPPPPPKEIGFKKALGDEMEQLAQYSSSIKELCFQVAS